MKTLIIKDAVEQPIHRTGEVICRTNVRVPKEESFSIWIGEDMVDSFQKMINENPDYFLNEGITEVHILKPDELVQRHLWYLNRNVTIDTEKYLSETKRLREEREKEKKKDSPF